MEGSKWTHLSLTTGIPNRVGRLKSLGNAVVPQQFYPIFHAIAEVMYFEADGRPDNNFGISETAILGNVDIRLR